jgi:hypothetical protein
MISVLQWMNAMSPLRLQAEGAPVIAIDPTEANRRAVRAYYNAGFRIDSTFSSEEGPGVVMLFMG